MAIMQNEAGIPANSSQGETGAGRSDPLDAISEGAVGHSVSFTRQQRLIHWAVAGLVIVQLPIGYTMWMAMSHPGAGSNVAALRAIHVIIGALIFVVMLRRLQLRHLFGTPPSPPGTPLDTSVIARINHQGFYVILLAMPVVGLLALLGGAGPNGPTAFGVLHRALAYLLVFSIFAHLLGVAYHRFIRGDGLLKRMTEGLES